jgi:WD40 repeat protein
MQPLFQTRPSFLVFPFRPERFSPDGRFVAVSLTNGVVQVWDVSQSVLLHELSVHTATALPVCFLSQGKKLIVMQPDDNSLQEWDLTRRQRTQSWSGVPRLSAVAFSPDEGWCLMAGYQGDSLLRDMATGRQSNPKLSIGTTESLIFSPDGKLIAAADWLSVARLWDAATLREVATLRRFLLGAHSAAFSKDGTRLAVSSGGKETLKLWSVESHQELLTLESQESRFVQSAFSPDGNVLGALSMEGFLHLWRSPTWREIEAAEKERGSYEAKP